MQLKNKLKCWIIMVLAMTGLTANAQSFENAGAYMEYIGKKSENLTSLYLAYLSAVGHNKSARKVDKRRQEVVDAIFYTRTDIAGMAPWKGDRSLRDSTVSYLKLLYKVFNEDYAKIVNMEEIAEQSYDAMEAYMLAKEKAGEKLVEAGKMQELTQKTFALAHNIKIVDHVSELEAKSREASKLMGHYGEVYLAFFKPYKQEMYLLDALQRKDLTALEQNKNALQTTAQEGLAKLKTAKEYNGDPSLTVACRNLLNFYIDEAKQTQAATDFLLKEAAFAKIKKAFDSTPASKRTQKDVDDYNNGINDINNAINAFNNSQNALNKQRGKLLEAWNKTVSSYLDNYMPVQRKG
jgi:hypothetical protein